MPPKKNKVVLDSSALLAYWNDEPGWQRIEPYQGLGLISAVNAAEVMSCLIRNGVEASKAQSAVHKFVSAVVPYDDLQAYVTGQLVIQGKKLGLSLGDRACIGLGLQQKLPILTGDKIWQEVKLDVEIKVFR